MLKLSLIRVSLIQPSLPPLPGLRYCLTSGLSVGHTSAVAFFLDWFGPLHPMLLFSLDLFTGYPLCPLVISS